MQDDSRLTLTALVACTAIMIAVATGPAQAERLPFSQAVVDAAMNEPNRYAPSEACPGPAYSSLKQIGTSHCVLRPAQAFYFLALTAYLDPSYRDTQTQSELTGEKTRRLSRNLS